MGLSGSRPRAARSTWVIRATASGPRSCTIIDHSFPTLMLRSFDATTPPLRTQTRYGRTRWRTRRGRPMGYPATPTRSLMASTRGRAWASRTLSAFDPSVS